MHEPTWCPGCGNFGIFTALKNALTQLSIKPTDAVAIFDIGCNSNMIDWSPITPFVSLHGRPLPVAQGVKMANKKSVRNVMFAYLKDAAYSTVTPGTTTQMQGMPKPGEMVSPMTTDTVKNKREFEKRNKAIEDMKKRMSPTTTGTPGKY